MHGMELEVLGNWSAGPGPDGACSGYLVRDGKTKLLLDCGPGVVPALQRRNRCSELSAIFISHMHADHCLDLLSLAYRLIRFSWRHGECAPDQQRRIPLFLPPGGFQVLEYWLQAFGRPAPSRSANPFCSAFDVQEWESGERREVGSLVVSSLAVQHTIPSLGFRVTSLSGVLAYSGDTRSCRKLAGLAEGADLFLCEATERDPESPTVKEGLHLTASQAGAAASEAGAKALLLTHLIRQDQEWTRELVTDAMTECRVGVQVTTPGKVYGVRSGRGAITPNRSSAPPAEALVCAPGTADKAALLPRL